MSNRSPFTWLRDQYCKPVVYQENGTTYEATPCGCPSVECPGSHPVMYAPLAPIGLGLIIALLVITLLARRRARKRATTLHGS